MERRVLAVDGEQKSSSPLPGVDREIAGGDEALLVGERERHPSLERPQGRADAGEPDHGIQDEIGLGRIEELREVAADLEVLHAVRGGEVVERLRARRERADREIRMRIHDLERLPPDGAGGPEQRNPPDAGGHGRRLTGFVFRERYARPHRALGAPVRDGRQPVRRAVPSERHRAARGRRRDPRRLLAGSVRPLAHDRALRGPRGERARRLESRVPARRERRRVAGDVPRRRRGSRPAGRARRAARSRAVGAVGHSAGGHLALWAAARARLPAGAPGADAARSAAGGRLAGWSCRPTARRRDTAVRRADASAARLSLGRVRARLAARARSPRRRAARAARRTGRHGRHRDLALVRRCGPTLPATTASFACCRVRGTSSTSTPRARRGGVAEGLARRAAQLSAARSERDEALERRRGRPRRPTSAAEPTTTPSASSAAAAACAGVEIPKPA